MPTTTSDAAVAGGKAAADKQLRADFELLAGKVADLEKTYRDLGLKFFVLPTTQRAYYFGADFEDAEKVFLPTDEGCTSPAAQLLLQLRPALDYVKSHLHFLRYEHLHDREFEGAEERMAKANELLARVNAIIRPWVDKMGGFYPYGPFGDAQVPMDFVLQLQGSGLPTSDFDDRYDDFCDWALTVRDVQNLIALGESEDQAIASLRVEAVKKEEMIVPNLAERVLDPEYDADNEASDDDYFSNSEDEERDDEDDTASNPWEDRNENMLERLGYDSDYDESQIRYQDALRHLGLNQARTTRRVAALDPNLQDLVAGALNGNQSHLLTPRGAAGSLSIPSLRFFPCGEASGRSIQMSPSVTAD